MAVEVMYAFQNNIFIPGLFFNNFGQTFYHKNKKMGNKKCMLESSNKGVKRIISNNT